jgi:hypothetical protein
MSDLPPPPMSGRRPATPRWVKGLGVLLLAAALIVAVVLLQGGDQHGPGRHPGVSDPAEQRARSLDSDAPARLPAAV